MASSSSTTDKDLIIQLNMLDVYGERLAERINVEKVLRNMSTVRPELKEKILNKDTANEKARSLFAYLIKNVALMGEFRQALNIAGYEYIVSFLNEKQSAEDSLDEFETVWEYTQVKLRKFVENVDPMELEMTQLDEFIDNEDWERIRTRRDTKGKQASAELMVKIFGNCRPGWFNALITVLHSLDQKSIFDEWLPIEPGIVAEITREFVDLQRNPQDAINRDIAKKGIPAPDNDDHPGAHNTMNIAVEHIDETCNEASVDSKQLVVSLPPENLYSDEKSDSSRSSEDELDEKHESEVKEKSENEKRDMNLRSYQRELAKKAEGKNVIIQCGTGTGKTRVATKIIKDLLVKNSEARVIMIVPTKHLVTQHHDEELKTFLETEHIKVKMMSGDTEQRIPLSHMITCESVIVLTADLFLNALKNQEPFNRVNIKDLSLIIFDECHHCHSNHPYLQIMQWYFAETGSQLPQIVGLTASIGTGGKCDLVPAKKHILNVCANMDAIGGILTVQDEKETLDDFTNKPEKCVKIAKECRNSDFAEVIHTIMRKIINHNTTIINRLTSSIPFGTQSYEAFTVELEKQGSLIKDLEVSRKIQTAGSFLRELNNALMFRDNIRMKETLQYLNEFIINERLREKYQDFNDYDTALIKIYTDNHHLLDELSHIEKFENTKLDLLEQILIDAFLHNRQSRVIVFVMRRFYTIALKSWCQDNIRLANVGIVADRVIGNVGNSGLTSGNAHMTEKAQLEVIRLFRKGEVNLVFATTVAEEGMDIPACNLVIRYDHSTNETATVQARGRARQKASRYIVLGSATSGVINREETNEYKAMLVNIVLQSLNSYGESDFVDTIRDIQNESKGEWHQKKISVDKRKMENSLEDVSIQCKKCKIFMCHGTDLRIVGGAHHVVKATQFKNFYKVEPTEPLKFETMSFVGKVSCYNCGQLWGNLIIYKDTEVPSLGIKNIVINIKSEPMRIKKWSDVTFKIPDYTLNN